MSTLAVNKATDVAGTSFYELMKHETAKSATSTVVDFTGIPSWVKKITVVLQSISTSSTSAVLIQLGDSGGIENTGYTSTAENSGAGAGANYTTGFGVERGSAASYSRTGIATIINITANTWVLQYTGYEGSSFAWSVGFKTLTGTLDRVRLTTVNGTDTFDAGTINILYEGYNV
jgi:hypothetical protein